MIKRFLTKLGRADMENIWFSFKTRGPSAS